MKPFDVMRPTNEYDRILKQREIDGNDFFLRYHQQFIETKCPACGTEGEFSFIKFGFSHKICPQCKTLFCSPRPPNTLISLYYNEYRAPQLWTDLLLKTDIKRKTLQYAPRVISIINSFQPEGEDKKRTALDIGAGSGAFTICLKNTGYFKEVIALDISKSCVDACKNHGLLAKEGSIEDIETNSMDFISMNDLIEHVYDPQSLLEECYRSLKPRGYISIATPNGEGFDFKIIKEKTKNITPPEHLNYFNPYSIDLLLKKVGFIPISIETPGILDVDIVRKERDSGFPLTDKNEYINLILSQDKTIIDNFQKFIANNKLSSHMLVIAQKGTNE